MDYQCDPSRFWSKVRRGDGCWEWQAFVDPSTGYGKFGVPDEKRPGKYGSEGAHRIAYKLTVGEIPVGLELDHLCRNRKCVRPDHLEAVTHRVNALRGIGVGAKHAMKTHDIHGHPLTPDNLVPSSLKKGRRECAICRRASNARRYR